MRQAAVVGWTSVDGLQESGLFDEWKKGMHGRDSREEYFEMEISLSKDGAETTICTSSMS